MNERASGRVEPDHTPETQPIGRDEQGLISGFLDRLQKEDPPAAAALLEANPEWAECRLVSRDLYARIRAALTGLSVASFRPTPAQAAEHTCAGKPRSVTTGIRGTPAGVSTEPPGILTSVTRQVPPERAIELYRKIAPVFVYQVLNCFNESASIRTVHRIVEHLCRDDTQRRLRACEHVRDAILDEFRSILGRGETELDISREDLQRLLGSSGALNDLIAMENCIRLAATKAS